VKQACNNCNSPDEVQKCQDFVEMHGVAFYQDVLRQGMPSKWCPRLELCEMQYFLPSPFVLSDNYNKIAKFNSERTDVVLGLNKFADLTGEEFKNQYSRCAFVEDNEEIIRANTLEQTLLRDLPESVDWRDKGVVTPVKNQAQCGSCWAFSTVGVLESFYALKNNKLVSFSEQQIVDCDTTDFGCSGGWPYQALTYAAKNGLETEEDYPYKAVNQKCTEAKNKEIAINTGYKFITPKSADALKTALVDSPVSIAIEADQSVFQFYKSGVLSEGCGAGIDHAVLAVGYTKVDGKEAYIVKNSWDTTWGDQGYIMISTDESANAGQGVCGILYQPVVPQ